MNAPDTLEDQDMGEEIAIVASSMASPPKSTREASQALEITIVASSMMSPPKSIGEVSQAPIHFCSIYCRFLVFLIYIYYYLVLIVFNLQYAPSWFGHNVDPLKFHFKKTPKSNKVRKEKAVDPRSEDEPSTKPRTASKRLHFDDPPQL
ncbi:uncharacterized protein LOC131030350 [Cryptomeria japonica]|uniref:uncharacterized protein LOC131030350 n=1 Tax=Cryptomeria japonica TaxID=3369 RepID=UPI0025AC69A1|nr:uncharacterized protein LOC131030350 [Cryptomeria japonica]XP_057817100.1 uncharacterized protein LOC131030350 [Cryptomeria japonica]XP_057817101.1 uncharacterized protein LOC131030350 [Cryptomeria japonica]